MLLRWAWRQCIQRTNLSTKRQLEKTTRCKFWKSPTSMHNFQQICCRPRKMLGCGCETWKMCSQFCKTRSSTTKPWFCSQVSIQECRKKDIQSNSGVQLWWSSWYFTIPGTDDKNSFFKTRPGWKFLHEGKEAVGCGLEMLVMKMMRCRRDGPGCFHCQTLARLRASSLNGLYQMTSNAEPARNLSYFQNWHQWRLNYQLLNLPPMVSHWPDTW